MKKLAIALIIIFCQPVYAGSILVWGSCSFNRCIGLQPDFNEPPYYTVILPEINDFIDVAMSFPSGFGLRANGEVIGWGSGGILDVPEGNFIDIDAGSYHVIALTDEGYLVAWGNNYHNQCDVSTESGWIKIAAESSNSAALKNDGTIGYWGYLPPESNEPTGNDYIDVKVSSGLILALKANGELKAWGKNNYGQLDDLPEGTFKAIGCGLSHCLAVRTDGTLEAWGWNDYGQCDVPEGNDYIAVDGGYYHSIALKENGSLVSWGHDFDCNVPDVCSIQKISVGAETNLALTSESTLVLTIDTEPNDINNVLPGKGDIYCYVGEQVLINAPRCSLCPYVWSFDYWTGDIGEPNSQSQFMQMYENKTITAHYKRLDRVCGDDCHPILQGDVNGDCRINFDDFAIYADSWLACTHPDCD